MPTLNDHVILAQAIHELGRLADDAADLDRRARLILDSDPATPTEHEPASLRQLAEEAAGIARRLLQFPDHFDPAARVENGWHWPAEIAESVELIPADEGFYLLPKCGGIAQVARIDAGTARELFLDHLIREMAAQGWEPREVEVFGPEGPVRGLLLRDSDEFCEILDLVLTAALARDRDLFAG